MAAMHRRSSMTSIVAGALLLLGCGGGGGDAAPPAPPPAAADELTAFQLEHGIGPITEPMTLPAEIDHELAEEGEEIFAQKCSACHKMAEKYIGPELGTVLDRRTPAFVMNMILNPQEMIEKHPVVKQMLAETMSFMANQGLTREDARAVVEYIRTQHP